MKKYAFLVLVFVFLIMPGCSHVAADKTGDASAAKASSSVSSSPVETSEGSANTPSSTNDAGKASTAYQRLLAGDFTDVRAKAGVTDTGEDYARQYVPFYSATPDENKWAYTLVDMDSDDIPELFIRLETSPDVTAIFHWTNDGIICWEFDTVDGASYFTPLENGMIWSRDHNSNNIYTVNKDGDFTLNKEFNEESIEKSKAYIKEHLSSRVIQPENWYATTDMTALLNMA